ncbi:MAB_1171c family putative transporter [Streptomyces spiramenti]|uniref:DUF6545 domain-containing protein n=1 Tax=Streptomyces spiramenti TaxID=2720606 RepID=A0ABX1AI81_9ACTN|nr:MAB_1171c family putative transporter [Streptomyces spiramenti]NJP64800.1 hypothetical protein [Streptomyces spiramenti]
MSTVELTITTLLWISATWRMAKDHRPGRSRALSWAFSGLAVMMTLRLPLGGVLDRATGIEDLSYLLKHLFGGVLAAAAVSAFLREVAGPGQARRSRGVTWYALPASTAVAMAALFFAKLQPYRTSVIYQDTAAHLALLGYTVIFLGYLSYVLIAGMRVCWRWGRASGNGVLGWGLRLVGIGLAAGVGYAVVRVAVLTAQLVGEGILPRNQEDVLATGLLLAALLLIISGTSLPLLDKAGAWRRNRLALLRLRPLWRELTDAVPAVRLHSLRHPVVERLDPRCPGERLYRRTMEIRDASLVLNDYASPCIRRSAYAHVTAAGLIGTQAETAAEACRLASARAACLRGDIGQPQPNEPSGGGRDLPSESRALEQLSAAYFSDLTHDFLAASADAETRAPEPP